MPIKENSKLYYLIINGEGKFNFSNKGFQGTPHYVSLVTAKYRVRDLISDVARFFNPARDLYRIDNLTQMKIRAYTLNSNYGMILDPNSPEMNIREFAISQKMNEIVNTYDALVKHLPVNNTVHT